MKLLCGCERTWVVDGKVTMDTHDSMNGTCYKCPLHGWTHRASSSSTTSSVPTTHRRPVHAIDDELIRRHFTTIDHGSRDTCEVCLIAHFRGYTLPISSESTS